MNALDPDRLRPPQSSTALGIVGESAALQETLELANKAARSDANILLCGESGTGKEGKCRKDLLFRINVIPIRLPPLREREGDVSLLATYLLNKYCEVDTGMIKRFDPEVMQAFERYSWPGNVRELQNVVRRMCVM